MIYREPTTTSIHFGPLHVDAVPLRDITELQQVRTEYNRTALEDLADAITLPAAPEDTTPHFDLQNPVAVARFSSHTQRTRYVHDHADFFRLDSDQRNHNFRHAGNTILVAGHRRHRAIGILAVRHELDLGDATIAASVHEDPDFGAALGAQLRENSHEKPSPQDEARAIHYYYEHIHATEQQPPSIRRIACELGFGETKVRDALSFASLPDDVQQLTHQNILPFSTVRQFKGLHDAYTAKYQAPRDAHDALMSDIARLLKTRLAHSDTKAVKWIVTRTQEVRAETTYHQDAFFELESSPRARRTTQASQLATEALRILAYQLKTGDLAPETLNELVPGLVHPQYLPKDNPPELHYA